MVQGSGASDLLLEGLSLGCGPDNSRLQGLLLIRSAMNAELFLMFQVLAEGLLEPTLWPLCFHSDTRL